MKANAAPVTATAYTGTGLVASTTYSYQASSLAGSTESGLSGAVSATTKSSFTCGATTASNYAHMPARRAHDSDGYALANGSNQNMGLNNTFYRRRWRRPRPATT
jgi:poly(3-hydroxybutyrate) depolymerase